MIAPVVVFKLKPVGSDPLVMAKLNGAIPPDVDIPVETVPTVIPSMLVEVMDTLAAGFAAIVPLKGLDWVWEAESVTDTVKL